MKGRRPVRRVRAKFDGFGFGANRDSMAGVPHFDDVTFIGRFPVAELEFHHAELSGPSANDGVQPVHPAQATATHRCRSRFSTISVENDTERTD